MPDASPWCCLQALSRIDQPVHIAFMFIDFSDPTDKGGYRATQNGEIRSLGASSASGR